MSDDHHHSRPRTPSEHRVDALESRLVVQGLRDTAAIDAVVEYYEHTVGPKNGARNVARAWTDAEYRARLLTDGTAAIAELGSSGPEGDHMVVVENTPEVHNVVVCTLCSCYPWPLLGLPPIWYKSFAYRARAVAEPRAVLSEFGVELGDDVRVRVWDSSSEVRYFVLPARPEGTDDLSEDELVALIDRNAMIGTGLVSAV
jgi:nitrile hydratase